MPSITHHARLAAEASKADNPSSTFQESDSFSSYNPSASVVAETKSVSSLDRTVSSNGSCSNSSFRLRTAEIRKPKVAEQSAFPTCESWDDTSRPTLEFDSVPLVGREKEVARLKICFDRMIAETEDNPISKNTSSHERKKELLLIHGKSGAGKSAVTLTLRTEVSKSTRGMFVTGKFDMNTSNEPYSGISRAFGDLCKKVMESPAEIVCAVGAGIDEQLGTEADLLVSLIPELKELISDTFSDTAIIDIGADEIENKLERLRFAFRELMKVLSSVFFPLVMFLDDLQWADISSLQVLEFLISDTQNENSLMIVGCYRSEEVDENSLLHNKMVALNGMVEKYYFNFTEISVGPIGIEGVGQVIAAVLSTPNADESLELARICHKRTQGNPFFVKEFLKMLHFEGLVHFDDKSQTWKWDLQKIDEVTMSTANVVLMLKDRIIMLPPQFQALLQCAAYLGSTFCESTIDLVWTTYGRRLIDTRIERTNSLLDAIVTEEILEKCDNHHFRWVHDKLQEAALHLTGRRRESFQLDIGRTLYYGLEKKQVEEELFTIVDLINQGNLLKLPEFASANLRAAEKSRELSAFQSASEYVANGLSLLKEDKWSCNRDLTLKLYTLGAEVEVMLGNADASNRYCRAVLSQPDLSTIEIVPLKMTMASTIGSKDLHFHESLTFYLRLLSELGCRVTWARRLVPAQAVVKLLRTIKRVKATPQSFYDKMVAIDDPRQKAIASIYSKLVYYSFIAGDMPLFVLGTCKLVELTLDHGINEYSAKSIASLASAVVVAMEDFETARMFNEIALSMLKRFRGMHNSETLFLAYCPGFSWVIPMEEVIAPMADAIGDGLRAGDTEFAIWNLVTSKLTTPIAIGRSVSSLLKECPKALIQCEDAGQSINALTVEILWQMLKNLHDSWCPNPTELEGDIFSAETDEEDNHVHVAMVRFAECELALFNGTFEFAANRALNVGDEFLKLFPSYPLIMVDVFHRAVPLYAAARRTRKRKYRTEAKRLLKKVAKWANGGNANVQYYYLLLTAEQLVLDKKIDMAYEKYHEAIKAVTATGHLHHLGLIHERYADFLLEVDSLEEESKNVLKKAIQYYKDWGAGVRVAALESRL